MPDRYSDYEQRPQQGGYGSSGAGRGAGGQARPAGTQQRRTAQSGASTGARPASQGGYGTRGANAGYTGGQTRPAGTQQRRTAQGGTSAGARPASQGGYGTRGANAGYTGGQARPAGTQQRRTAQSGASAGARPASQGGYGTRGANAGYTGGQARLAGVQQRRTAQGGASTSARPASQAPGRRPAQSSAGPRQTRPAQGTQRRRTTNGSQGGYGSGSSGMSPAVKMICGVLCVALLITICLAITSKIRERTPQPGISMSTDALSASQETNAPANEPTEQPAETPVPTEPPAEATDEPVQAASGRSVRIRAMGDVIIDEDMLEKAYTKSTDSYDFSPLFELAQGVMSDADWSIINIEATLREGRYGYSGYPQFSTPPSILDALKECGIDMLTMCNNHALDGYFDGLKMSLDLAEEAGFAHVGAYRTQEEHDTPEIYDIGGIKVGMLNYTQYTNGMASLSDENATIYGMRLMDGADYEGDIADLKAAGAEFTIAIMHWGKEYIREPEDSTKSVARRLVAAGADLVIGGHPHVVQPAEYVTATDANGNSRTALVIYSLGNFISNHRHENAAYTDNGIIFDFTLQENAAGEIELVDPYLIPVYVWMYDDGSEYAAYKVVASGDGAVSGMDSAQQARMEASYQEIVDLTGDTIDIRAH